MTDIALNPAADASAKPARRDIGLKRRYAAERRFKLYGITAIAIGIFFLVALIYSVFSNGYTAFWQTEVNLAINLDPKIIDPDNKRATDPNVLLTANYPMLARNALAEKLGVTLERTSRQCVNSASCFQKAFADNCANSSSTNPSLIGTTQNVWVLTGADIDSAFKGQIDLGVDQSRRKVSDQQVEWMNKLKSEGVMAQRFNTGLFTYGASSRPETSGLGVALIGSLYMMLIVLCLSLAHWCRCFDLSRGIRQEEPAHRYYRGQHQQSCGCSFDRFRPSRAGRLHQLLPHAAFGFAGRRYLC